MKYKKGDRVIIDIYRDNSRGGAGFETVDGDIISSREYKRKKGFINRYSVVTTEYAVRDEYGYIHWVEEKEIHKI